MGMGCVRTIRIKACVIAGLAVAICPISVAGASGIASGTDSRAQAIGCLTSAILHEAGFEPTAGQEAVAEVVLNRVGNRAYPKTVCGVIFQGSERRTGCQFSFTCDGSLRKSLPGDVIMRAQQVAARAIDGQLSARTFGATHYHADYVSPYWAPSLVRVTAIGRHIFYRQLGATATSRLGRYGGPGDRLPTTAQGAVLVSSSTLADGATPAPRKAERFMPWGLSPAVSVQAGSSAN